MASMNIATALLLAYNLINAGKPAQVVDVGNGQAIVIMKGRPGCRAEPAGKDANNPVVVCGKPASPRYR